MAPFNLDQLRLNPVRPAITAEVKVKPPRHKPGERFLKGPIPLNWLKKAAELPGKAILVGLDLWYRVGLTKSAEVKLSLSRSAFGCGRYSGGRGLKALEKAGLISVRRAEGKKAFVKVIAVDAGLCVKDENFDVDSE